MKVTRIVAFWAVSLFFGGLFALPFSQRVNAAPGGYVTLAGQVLPVPANARYLGLASASEQINLAVALPLRNQAALEGLIKRLYDPADSLYGEYLTPESFAEGYGATQADYDAVKTFLQSSGLTVTREFSNRLLISASGSAGAVESAFNVHFLKFQSVSGHIFHSIDADPAVPGDIAPKIKAIVGLDTSIQPVRFTHNVFEADKSLRPATLTGPDSSFGPTDLKTAYGLSPAALTAAGLSGTLDGSGQAVALIDLGGSYKDSDILVYTSYFSSYFGSNYTPPLAPISIDGYTPIYTGDWAGETTLDVECVLNMAPNLTKLLVFNSPGDFYSYLDTLSAVATDTTDTGTGSVANVVSMSLCWPESSLASYYEGVEAPFHEEFAAQGQTAVAASGDWSEYGDYGWGASTPPASDIAVNDPASQPYVTGVGGTTLTVDNGGAWKNEVVWNNSYNDQIYGGVTGGGVSSYWPTPDYQSLYIPNSNTSGYSTMMRNVPDVALDADSWYSPYAYYGQGAWAATGGTSAATPTWAGFIALVNQERAIKGHGNLGFANPLLYRLASGSSYSADFHDIVSGTMTLSGGLTLLGAAPGYDCATGWGSLNGANLMSDLIAIHNLATTTKLTYSAPASNYGTPVTFMATINPSVRDGDTVLFYNNGVKFDAATTSGSVATATTSTLPLGADNITARYIGNATVAPSASSVLTETVLIGRPTTAIASTVNPSTYGGSVAFTATINPSVPDGETVTFYDGAMSKAAIGTGTTSGGVATLNTSALGAGGHTIWAKYAGDANFTYSWSGSLAQTVNKATPVIAVTSSPNASNYGSSVTLTATSSFLVPNGETVTFYDGSTSIGTGATVGGIAKFATNVLAAGAHNLTARYPGDANYAASNSAGETQTVVISHPTTTLVSSQNPSSAGASLTLTGTISPSVPNGETVTFFDGASSKVAIGTALTSGNVAKLTTSSLAAGSHTLWAEYAGDANHAYSWSTGLAQSVVKSGTKTTLASSLNASNYSAAVTFTASIGSSVPNGETVTFYDGAASIGTGKTSAGKATFTTNALALGNHAITAGYPGDTNNLASTSSVLTQIVVMCHPTATLVSSLNPSSVGKSVTFTATVSPTVPDGEIVTFYDGATSKKSIGTGKTSGGVAKLTTSALTAGAHTIWAEYAGDANFAYCWSSGLAQTVQ